MLEVAIGMGVCFAIIGVGELVSYFTKALFPSMAAALFIYLILTWIGMPKYFPENAGFTYLGNIAMLLFIVHLGTSIPPGDYVKNIKRISVASAGVICGLVFVVGIGGIFFGFDTMLSGAGAACGGGAIAGILAIQQLTDLNLSMMIAVPAIIVGTVDFTGQPIASYILKKYTKKLRDEDLYLLETVAGKNKEVRLTKHGVPYGSEDNPSQRITAWVPKKLEEDGFVLFEVAAAVLFAVFLEDKTGFNSAIYAFFIGLIGCAVGLFRMNLLDRAHSGGFVTCIFIGWLLSFMNDITPQSLLAALAPVIATLVLAAVGMGLCAGFVGKLLKYDFFLSAASGVGLMFLMPGISIVCSEVASRSSRDEDERKYMHEAMAPSLYMVASVGYIIGVALTVSTLLPLLAKF
jgi:hypothetical protein